MDITFTLPGIGLDHIDRLFTLAVSGPETIFISKEIFMYHSHLL